MGCAFRLFYRVSFCEVRCAQRFRMKIMRIEWTILPNWIFFIYQGLWTSKNDWTNFEIWMVLLSFTILMKNHEMFSISSFSSTTEKYFGMHSLSQNCMIRPILNSPLNNWVCSIIGYLGFLYFCEAMQKARNFGAFRIACWVHFCRNENEAISSANRLSSLQGPGKLHGKQTTPNWFEKGNALF